MQVSISSIKRKLELDGEVTVDCGNSCIKTLLSSYKNSTEAAIAVMGAAKHAPFVCCDNAGECDCPPVNWMDRIDIGN